MNLCVRARQLADSVGGGWLTANDVERLQQETGLSTRNLLQDLIPLARTYAIAPLSGFEVGAVAEGVSGAIYFGANIEILGCPLSDAVHAEQSAVANAASHAERGLKRLAVSAAPCGLCRQFLWELPNANDFEILHGDAPPALLPDLLPLAFGPDDLGVVGGLLAESKSNVEWKTLPGPSNVTAQAAFEAVSVSYAPYTRAIAGVGITRASSGTYAGSYIENAAYNPSLAPFQAALAAASFGGSPIDDITEVALVQICDSKIDHTTETGRVLRQLSPPAKLRSYHVRIV